MANNIFNNPENIYNLSELNNLNKINENVKNTNIPVSVWNNSSANLETIGTARVDNEIEKLPESIKDAIVDHFINLSVARAPEQLNTTMTVIPMTGRSKRKERLNNNYGFAPPTPKR